MPLLSKPCLLPAMLLVWLCACEAPPSTVATDAQASGTPETIAQALACGGVPVAHRGTSESWDEPENSLAALERIGKAGIPVAEIDVASTRDGVHFLFHDGVWDEASACEGPVAASTWEDASECLLYTRAGRATASTPPRLDSYLRAAREQGTLLEIDFKSSADYRTTIEAVRDAGMAERVVLIAYSDGQADALSRLAPEMWLSVPRDYPRFDEGRHLRWFGGDRPVGPGGSIAFHEAADLRVSDTAERVRWSCEG